MFGAIGDSCPDRWGRALINRGERKQAEKERRPPGALTEAHVLLMVDDEARQGALRFAESAGGRFVREINGTPIPSLAEIPKLLAAAEHVEEGTETDDEINLLLASGALLGELARKRQCAIAMASWQ